MSTTVRVPDTDQHRVRGSLLTTGAASFAVAGVWTVLGAHTWEEWASMLALEVVVTLGVYGVVIPKALERRSAGLTALILAVLAAALTVPAFWSGLPLILGVAGMLLGYAARRAARGAGLGIAAIVVGALAVIGYLTIYVVDGLLLGNL